MLSGLMLAVDVLTESVHQICQIQLLWLFLGIYDELRESSVV